MGLGSLDEVSLQQARERAAAARRLHKDGQDPIEAREAARSAKRLESAKATTFDQCASAYITAHRPGWRSAKHLNQWIESLGAYASPVIGPLLVQQVDVALVLKVIQPIWLSKNETASRVRQRIEAILDWATASGFRTGDNPARWRGLLENLLPPTGKIRKVKHLAAMPYSDVGAFLAELRKRDRLPARALEFTILTAARTGEVLQARWSEIDFDARVWTVPASRTKAHREHRVPLSLRAVEILRVLPRSGDLIFKCWQAAMLGEVPRGVTVHGFRSSFRDWCAEQTNFPREVAEAALGHIVGDSTERAYRRGDVLEKRRRLMQQWATFCSTAPAQQTEGNVAPFRQNG